VGVLSFRHLLEKHALGEKLLETVKPISAPEA
jgi:hypothetical protein